MALDVEGVEWSGDAPPTRSQVLERISALDVERKRLDAYLKALDELAEPINTPNSVSASVPISGAQAAMQPSNLPVNGAANAAGQILLKSHWEIMLDAILPAARWLKNWTTSGEDRKNKIPFYSAMHNSHTGFAVCLLAFLFTVNCYRAATQSFVHDEALTFLWYVATPLRMMLDSPNTNNHPLNTYLMRVCGRYLGWSELSLRLPSVLAGGFYFVTVYRISRRAFGQGWLFLLSVLLAAANPIVLDFFVAARGYGLSLALFAYGLLQSQIYLSLDGSARNREGGARLMKAGFALGLSLSANATLLFPLVPITALLVWLLREETRPQGWKALPRKAAWLLIPMLAAGFIFLLTTPILRTAASNFNDYHIPNESPLANLRELINSSLAHNTGLWRLNGDSQTLEMLRFGCGLLVIPAVLITAVLCMRPNHRAIPSASLALLSSAGVIGAAALILVAWYAGGIALPQNRTGLYFMPLAGFSLVAACQFCLYKPGMLRWAGLAFGVAAVLTAALYCVQFQWTYFLVWKYDADTRTLLKRIEARRQTDHGPWVNPAGVTLSGTWLFAPSSNFYRITKHWNWLLPVDRDRPDRDGDYFLLDPGDAGVVVKARNLSVLAVGKTSETTLASK